MRAALVVLPLVVAVAVGWRLYVLWRRMRIAEAVAAELIEANRARWRPGMERRDDRLLQEAGRRRRS